jgi:hypothetical protein
VVQHQWPKNIVRYDHTPSTIFAIFSSTRRESENKEAPRTMSRRFDRTENAQMREKIDKAKPLLSMPDLMRELGYEEKHIGKTALCPFHSDQHPSFSVFLSSNGKGWQWKCHAGCGYGDEIAFLVKHFGISRPEAITRFLDLAGFPSRSSSKSHEYPCVSCVSVSPCVSVSEGQGTLEQELKALAAQYACTGIEKPEDMLWQFARDVKAVEKRIGRKLNDSERLLAFDEWRRLSQSFLDQSKTASDYFTMFLAQLKKVRVPTSEGVIEQALQVVSKLSDSDLPELPGYLNASRKARLIAALHRELSCRSERKDKTYFLSYRDAARVCDGLSHQEAHTITFALDESGVIKIVSKGQSGANGGKAAEFVYLLSQSENGAEDDGGFDL